MVYNNSTDSEAKVSGQEVCMKQSIQEILGGDTGYVFASKLLSDIQVVFNPVEEWQLSVVVNSGVSVDVVTDMTRNDSSVDRWKKQFKQLLEDTGYVTPGKLLSEVRVLFMGRECFEALSEDDCHYIYDKHQKDLMEKAKHNFQVRIYLFCYGLKQ